MFDMIRLNKVVESSFFMARLHGLMDFSGSYGAYLAIDGLTSDFDTELVSYQYFLTIKLAL